MILKKGATRYVLLTKTYAFKIPYLGRWKNFLLGLLSNMQEVEFNTMMDERLCPIVFHIPGGFLTVMPRCEELTDKEWMEFSTHLQDESIMKLRFVETKKSSYGKLNGIIVAVDYGS